MQSQRTAEARGRRSLSHLFGTTSLRIKNQGCIRRNGLLPVADWSRTDSISKLGGFSRNRSEASRFLNESTATDCETHPVLISNSLHLAFYIHICCYSYGSLATSLHSSFPPPPPVATFSHSPLPAQSRTESNTRTVLARPPRLTVPERIGKHDALPSPAVLLA